MWDNPRYKTVDFGKSTYKRVTTSCFESRKYQRHRAIVLGSIHQTRLRDTPGIGVVINVGAGLVPAQLDSTYQISTEPSDCE